MSRIANIIKRARITLADKNAERWSDDDLLELLNEGHKDLCLHSKILKGTYNFAPEIGVASYTLPDDIWTITRVTINRRVLPIVSHTDLDMRCKDAWEAHTGFPLAIIYDRRNVNQLRVYPVPGDVIANTEYAFTEYFGVIDTVQDFGLSAYYGTTSTLVDPDALTTSVSSEFGAVSAIEDTDNLLTCYYLKVPQDLVSVADTLVTPAIFDTALKYYVVGHAFLNDLNEMYQAKGAQQLQFYQRELTKAVETSTLDATRTSQFQVLYNTPFR